MKIEKYLKESKKFRVEDYYSDPAIKKVSKISQDVNYDIYKAAAFAIELLTDVNFHEAARTLDLFVTKHYSKKQ